LLEIPNSLPFVVTLGSYFSASATASGTASVCPPASTVSPPASGMIAGPYNGTGEHVQVTHKSVVPTAIIAARPRRGDVCPEQGPWQTPEFDEGTSAVSQNGHAVSVDSTWR